MHNSPMHKEMETLRKRIGDIDAKTSVYGVVGYPVSHSLSPAMHNKGFKELGFNGIYLPFPVTDLPEAIAAIRSMGIKGVSVTLPHKVPAMALMDEINETAEKIGAVNTIVNHNGRILGYNTDAAGAITALNEKTDIRGKIVWIIGAGGAARAVVYGVVKEGGHVTILNRTTNKGKQLAKEFGVLFQPLSKPDRIRCDILINATPVGMVPDTASMPINPAGLRQGMVVMDIIYNPIETRLLKTAQSRGCTTIDGIAMFVYQGARQFEMWTGQQAPTDVMKQTVKEALNKGQ